MLMTGKEFQTLLQQVKDSFREDREKLAELERRLSALEAQKKTPTSRKSGNSSQKVA